MVDTKLNSTLAYYVRKVMEEKGLTYEQVAKNSNSTIHQGQVYSIANECQRQVSVESLKALSVGLDVNEDDLFDVARGVDGLRRYKPHSDLARLIFLHLQLNEENREAVKDSIAIVANQVDGLVKKQHKY